ncbi:hypothetical protein C0Q70_14737 [Pomacea canaliculata]|uniref:Uncharacterized protein n=1 Tax=Pomacea canaliculata TaxID=400727 RepID=A0A2T7NSY3_POMCA|nr:hypothetical protein C0Q70_14737 [Pomacea canaliculata]
MFQEGLGGGRTLSAETREGFAPAPLDSLSSGQRVRLAQEVSTTHTLWRVPTSLSPRDSNTHERQLTGKIRANLYTLQPSFISLSSTSQCSHLCPGRKGGKRKVSQKKKGRLLKQGSNRGTTNKAAWEIFFLALTCAATDIEQVEREKGGDGEKRERERQTEQTGKRRVDGKTERGKRERKNVLRHTPPFF